MRCVTGEPVVLGEGDQIECVKNPTPSDGKWGNPNRILNEVGLLPAAENQSESTEAEKGGGGWFWNRFNQLEARHEAVA
jgi:hypothetical protein